MLRFLYYSLTAAERTLNWRLRNTSVELARMVAYLVSQHLAAQRTYHKTLSLPSSLARLSFAAMLPLRRRRCWRYCCACCLTTPLACHIPPTQNNDADELYAMPGGGRRDGGQRDRRRNLSLYRA